MQTVEVKKFVEQTWEASIVPRLFDYMRIPNKSPLYDPQWEEHGHMARAVALIEEWCRAQGLRGMSLEVVRLPGRTPLLFIDVPGDGQDCVLLYGHLDKQ